MQENNQDNTQDLQWLAIDTNTLPEPMARKYQSLVELNTQASNRRKEFETMARQQLESDGKIPAGHEAIFSYRYGRVSIAFKPYGSKGKVSAKSTFKFA